MKKPRGRKPKADSQARAQELVELLSYLEHQKDTPTLLSSEYRQWAYEKLRDLILQVLAKEPAYRAWEIARARAWAVREAHAKGAKLTMDKGGAFAIASEYKILSNTAAKGGASTMQKAYQAEPLSQIGPIPVEVEKKLRTLMKQLNRRRIKK